MALLVSEGCCVWAELRGSVCGRLCINMPRGGPQVGSHASLESRGMHLPAPRLHARHAACCCRPACSAALHGATAVVTHCTPGPCAVGRSRSVGGAAAALVLQSCGPFKRGRLQLGPAGASGTSSCMAGMMFVSCCCAVGDWVAGWLAGCGSLLAVGCARKDEEEGGPWLQSTAESD